MDVFFKILDEYEIKTGVGFPEDATISLENIKFAYDGMEENVLENFSCEFQNGKKYFIAGKSGEGKSTLIKLLLGILEPQEGLVLFGNIPVTEIDSHSLLENMGAVMQENMFFNLSIRENLELVAPKASEDDLIFALKAACLYDFIEELPQKLDTIIGEQGIKLSGGQKQRLAIARLILHYPQIVILDEATSALDSVVESKIFDNLNEIFKDKTMIVISHKPLINFRADKAFGVFFAPEQHAGCGKI